MTSIKEALEFYANPEIYKPHPHGSAFDDRDLSFRAKSALASLESGDARERIARIIASFDWPIASKDERERWIEENWQRHIPLADAILATGLVTDEAAAKDEDEAYEIGKRDGYESAIQDIDIATGGDGEFKGSTIPGVTVDVPAMKARVIERLRDEARLRQCAICGFTIDTSFAAAKPSADFTTRGRAKLAPDEASIRADEREKCAKVCDQIRNNAERRAAQHENGEARNSALDKMEGAIQCAAAIRSGGGSNV